MTTVHHPAGRRATIELTVNGQRRSGQAEPRMLLSDFLRHELQAFGVHVGCEHGVCGACTVLVGGRAMRSCTQYAVQADGADITTVEGLAAAGTMNALQSAFADEHALQCGFCTPGILCSATHFLRDTPLPTEVQVRDMLSGHICRCTGYASIVAAILQAANPKKGS
ncbi:MAG TPA: (2Fe-2S)-binding protein [Bradyrhizobium sp.]|jgi:2-furoyl-CoA dehydrogenase 2Fe-2S iron sulfur subunit|nr:2-furoyl-CoA dehydrogenase 2Fe-2S iron sulfur subunit [Rhodospirillaceae bacterium]HWN78944.1 (2Fe-2S)-binding protein [Bradyrhizobium sp.]